MSEYIHLIGTEEVTRAASGMKSAAQEMLRAANYIEESLRLFTQRMEDLMARAEKLKEEQP